MTNKFAFLSNILHRPWAINNEYALNSGFYVASLLYPGTDVIQEEEPVKNKPHAISIIEDSLKYPDGYDDAPSGSIALIPIRGVLMKHDQFCGPAGMQTIGKRIQDADKHSNISSIILLFDTPGGSVDGIKTLSDIIKNTQKPITAFVDGSCFSGGMWLASHCDKIIASTDIDELGSIGVMTSFIDVKPAWERLGVKFHEIYSNLSKDKNKLFREMQNGEYENYKTDKLDPLALEFRNVIKQNRPGVTDDQLTGKTYFAKDLIGSLIDQIASFEEAVKISFNLSENTNIKIKNRMMNNLNNLAAIAGVESFEVQDGGIFVSEQIALQFEQELVNRQSAINDANARSEELKRQLQESAGREADLHLEVQRLTEMVEVLKQTPAASSAQVIVDSNAVKGNEENPCVSNKDASIVENILKVKEAYL